MTPHPFERTMFSRRFSALLLVVFFLHFPARSGAGETGPALFVTIEGAINPAIEHYVKRAVAEAKARKASVLVIEIDTPGGLLESTKNIASAMIVADVPVVVYVYPEGATATSAGFFILMAGDVAAMAPSTSTGSAHPVSTQGQMDRVMSKKVTHYAAAHMKSLVERQGRNQSFAEKAVRQSISVTAEEALKKNVVELTAFSPEDLLKKLEGRTYFKKTEKRTLRGVADAPVERMEMSLMERFLHLVASPNLLPILMMLGIAGLAFEVRSPGIGAPGVIGAICLILGLASASQLPVATAGMALFVLGVLMLAAEMFIVSHGLLTLGGVACILMGGLFLFDSDEAFYRVSWQVLGLLILFGLTVMTMVVASFANASRSRRRLPFEMSGMVGETAVAKGPIDPEGMALAHGELWKVVSETGEPIPEGERLVVTGVLENLRLLVRAADKKHPGS